MMHRSWPRRRARTISAGCRGKLAGVGAFPPPGVPCERPAALSAPLSAPDGSRRRGQGCCQSGCSQQHAVSLDSVQRWAVGVTVPPACWGAARPLAEPLVPLGGCFCLAFLLLDGCLGCCAVSFTPGHAAIRPHGDANSMRVLALQDKRGGGSNRSHLALCNGPLPQEAQQRCNKLGVPPPPPSRRFSHCSTDHGTAPACPAPTCNATSYCT